jgi:hypothetical protein
MLGRRVRSEGADGCLVCENSHDAWLVSPLLISCLKLRPTGALDMPWYGMGHARGCGNLRMLLLTTKAVHQLLLLACKGNTFLAISFVESILDRKQAHNAC